MAAGCLKETRDGAGIKAPAMGVSCFLPHAGAEMMQTLGLGIS